MRSRLLLLVTIVAIAGCAQFRTMTGKPGDSKENLCGGYLTKACAVEVTVTAGVAPKKCTIKVDQEHLFVAPGQHPITWTLSGPQGYHFTQGAGIAFNKKPRPPVDTFVISSGAGTRIVMMDNNVAPDRKGKWHYSISVTGGKDDDCIYDPDVDNN